MRQVVGDGQFRKDGQQDVEEGELAQSGQQMPYRHQFILRLGGPQYKTDNIRHHAVAFLQLHPPPPLTLPRYGNNNKMFSFNSVLQSLHPSKLVSTVTTNYSKLKERISPPLPITEVLPGLFHTDFPQRQHAVQLAEHTAGRPFLLINIGEYPYEDDLQKLLRERNPAATLAHLNFQLYGTLPFYELVETIAQVKAALARGEHAYVHCQEGRIRSAVFLASYLFVSGGRGISEAIIQVNKLLAIDLESSTTAYKNQHALFKNLVNYTTDRNFINAQQLRLERLTIANAPRICPKDAGGKAAELTEVQVVLEVRCGPDVIHRCIYKECVRQGEEIVIEVGKLGKKVVVGDEFLIVVKYLHKQTLYNVMRIQANTNFIFNCFARVHQHDIDLSSHCRTQHPTRIDLAFAADPAPSRLAQLARPAPLLPVANKDKSWDLLGTGDSQLYAQEERFEWLQEQPDIDENELNSKIEQVMLNMNRKEEERGEDKENEEEEEDFDDYLGKLESQA